MLHDTRDENIFSVWNGINFTLLPNDIRVDKNWVVWTSLNRCTHVRTKIFFIFYDFHGTSTKYIRWANKNWEANLASCKNCFFFISSRLSWWLWNIQILEGLFKEVTVFRTIQVSNLCTKDGHTCFCQWLRKVDGCLTTELNDNTFWLLQVNDVHNIFKCQWLKVKFIWYREVCWNSLWVWIHDDGFIASSLDSLNWVNRCVVKLDPLTNTDWTRT